MIKIHKHIERKILRDFFLIEGTVDVDADYLINKIKQGVQAENNQNHKTYIKALMTDWKYFNNDIKFLESFQDMITYCDSTLTIPTYALVESWGLITRKNEWTSRHDHHPNILSGVLYLNDHPQTLDFDELAIQIKPAKGRFVLFSPLLNHKCFPNKVHKEKFAISFNCWLVRESDVPTLGKRNINK